MTNFVTIEKTEKLTNKNNIDNNALVMEAIVGRLTKKELYSHRLINAQGPLSFAYKNLFKNISYHFFI